jgi:hypothetical protein
VLGCHHETMSYLMPFHATQAREDSERIGEFLFWRVGIDWAIAAWKIKNDEYQLETRSLTHTVPL